MSMLLSINKMYPPDMGGVEVVAKELAELGLEIFEDSQVLSFNGSLKTVLENIGGVTVLRLSALKIGRSIRIPYGYVKMLEKMSREASMIVYHFPSFMPELLMIKSRTPKICFYQADIVGRGMIGYIYNKIVVPRFLDQMDYIVTSSPNLATSSSCLQGRRNLFVIPLGIDTAHFHPNGNHVREKLLSDLLGKEDDKVILFVGRLARYKGIEVLIQAIALLPEQYKLVVVTKDHTEKLTESLRQMNLLGRVGFYTNVTYDELPEFYRSADVFCMPSTDRGEAFGLVAVEAMACGTPVITTELGTGTSYHNLDGVTGRIVAPRSIAALKEAIVDICENKERYDATIIRARAEEFSLENFRTRWKDFFNQI